MSPGPADCGVFSSPGRLTGKGAVIFGERRRTETQYCVLQAEGGGKVGVGEGVAANESR